MDDSVQLNQLATVLLWFTIYFGVVVGSMFVYIIGWILVGITRLSKYLIQRTARKKAPDPNETLWEVDDLLKKQQSDYIFSQLAK